MTMHELLFTKKYCLNICYISYDAYHVACSSPKCVVVIVVCSIVMEARVRVKYTTDVGAVGLPAQHERHVRRGMLFSNKRKERWSVKQ
jgi:hypothetical protein